MFGWFESSRNLDVLFLCSSCIDEVWIRSAALVGNKRGLRVAVAICGDANAVPRKIQELYQRDEVPLYSGISFKKAAKIKVSLVVTASSGLDREIFPTRARFFIHMPHSLASLHMIYPEDAFSGFDILFAAGPQHRREFALLNVTSSKRDRRVFDIGYGKLDVLKAIADEKRIESRSGITVLIAPSWGVDNLLDRCGIELAKSLVEVGFDVVVRPHPLFFLDKAPVIEKLKNLERDLESFRLESPFDEDRAIFEADLLIGDYSGISFEFFALRGKPVISVNVGLKIANPNWKQINIEPVEIALRSSLGIVVSPDVAEIVTTAKELCSSELGSTATDSFLFGEPGSCASAAVTQLTSLLAEVEA